MGVRSHRLHRRLMFTSATLTFLLLLLLASVPALGFNPSRHLSVGVRNIGEEVVEPLSPARRRLGGPGSYPPSCRSKCEECRPCRPVHVPVQPGMSVPLEYYPEAWRCECGNKLFMP